jgi:hypothetical protein
LEVVDLCISLIFKIRLTLLKWPLTRSKGTRWPSLLETSMSGNRLMMTLAWSSGLYSCTRHSLIKLKDLGKLQGYTSALKKILTSFIQLCFKIKMKSSSTKRKITFSV